MLIYYEVVITAFSHMCLVRGTLMHTPLRCETIHAIIFSAVFIITRPNSTHNILKGD